MPVRSESIVYDCRWILLLVLSICVSLHACKGNTEQELTKRNASNAAPRTWHEKGLSWDSVGPLGPGVYCVKSKSYQKIADPQGIAAGDYALVSPRLAVFIFRPYDLNQVDIDTLQIVKGIGPKLALAIVNYRLAHGPFHSVDELLAVKGIGRAKLASLRNYLDLPIAQP